MELSDLVALFRDSAAWTAVAERISGLFEPDFELEVVGLTGLNTIYTGVSGFRDAWLDWLAPWETYPDELQEVDRYARDGQVNIWAPSSEA